MQYRPEIDGLRAIAVLPVILFHAGFSWFSGGYIGVDVFFVISGYLITSILLSDLDKGTFSIVKFYERRARRILPALFFIMIFCMPIAWNCLLPQQFKVFSQSLVYITLFSSNIFFLSKEDYFAPTADENPFLHTWSLSVEEQFYIFFPFLLLALWRFGRNPILYVILVLSMLSLLLSEWGWRNYPAANFYLLPTRAWELGLGAACAFMLYKKTPKDNQGLSLLGLALILCSVFAYSENVPFPSFYALPPVLGTALVIIYGGKSSLVGSILRSRFFVGIGVISYSAYLWHQPIFAFARIKSFNEIEAVYMLLLIFISLVLAWFTWKFIETPFRLGRISFFKTRKQVFSVSGVAVLSVLSFGLVGHYTNGADWRSVGLQTLSYEPDNKVLQRQSWKILKEITGEQSYSVQDNAVDGHGWSHGQSDHTNILLVGNSHSKDLFNVLYYSRYLSEGLNMSRYGSQIRDLSDSNNRFYTSENFFDADIVILVSRYSESDISELETVIDQLVYHEKEVVLVKNIFEFDQFGGARNLSDYMLSKLSGGEELVDNSSSIAEIINRKHFEKYSSRSTAELVIKANEVIDKLAEKKGITVLDRMDYVCDSEAQLCYAIDSNYNKFFYDYGHHTLAGAQFFGKRVSNVDWLKPVLAGDSDLPGRHDITWSNP